jgi:hypothetical protein
MPLTIEQPVITRLARERRGAVAKQLARLVSGGDHAAVSLWHQLVAAADRHGAVDPAQSGLVIDEAALQRLIEHKLARRTGGRIRLRGLSWQAVRER